jgi:protoheme IX farnesyltransferase
MPWALGYAGALYGVVAFASGAVFLAMAVQLRRSQEGDRQTAQRLFLFSISYLFLLFAALLANSIGDRSSWTVSSREEGGRITRTIPVAALRAPFRAAIPFNVAK